MTKSKSISVSLDPEIVSVLTKLSRRLGMSRSALIGMVLSESKSTFVKYLDVLGEEGDVADAKRLRGVSVDLIMDSYKELLQQTLDLDVDSS